MSILSLTPGQFATIKAYNPLPFVDAAYQRMPGLTSYLLTPYRLQQMYALDASYRNNADLDAITKQLARTPDFIMVDLDNVLAIGNVNRRLTQAYDSINFGDFEQRERRQVFRYFAPERVRRRDEDWYGYDVREDENFNYVVGVKRVYPRLADANNFFSRFEDELRINPETDVPRPRLTYNSRGGVFMFSRIAPTLYAFPCYKVDVDDDQCLPTSSVITRDDRHYLADAPDVELVKDGIEKRTDGTGLFRTQTKKVFAAKEQKIRITPFINIYVNVTAASDVRANDYRYNSFAAIALAKLLITNGFKVSITALFVGYSNGRWPCMAHDFPYDPKDRYAETSRVNHTRPTLFLHKFTVKSYDELLDFNTALIYGGDPAFFRYDMFYAHSYGTWSWWHCSPDDLGVPETSEVLIDRMLDRFNINNLEHETRVVISGRFSQNAATDAVRTKLAALRLVYGGGS
jgi:hypothetical protein